MDIAPDGGLRMGAAIAQGAQNFVTAFQNARSMQLNYQLKQQELASQNELRQLQMAKLRSELEPTTVDFQKVAAAKQLMMGGYVDKKFYENTIQDAMDNVTTPAQAQYLNSAIQKDLMNRGAPSLGSVQQKDINAPDLGVSTDLSQKPQAQAGLNFNAPVQLNKAEKDLLEKSIGYQTTANVAAGRNQNNLDMQDLRNKGAQDLHALEAEFKFKLEQIQSEQRNREQQAKIQADKDLQAQKDKAAADRERMGINAGKYKRGSGAAGGSNQEIKSLDKQIEQARQAQNKLLERNSFGMVPSLEEIKSSWDGLQNQIDQLQSKRDGLAKGSKGSQSATGMAPAGQTPPGGVPIKASSKQDVMKAPVGAVIDYGGVRYKKLDANNSLEEVK